MPGQLRSMVRKVQQLAERQAALVEALHKLAPQQYNSELPNPRRADLRASLWRSALDGAEAAEDFLVDLVCNLQWRAEEADRARAADMAAPALADVDDDTAFDSGDVAATAEAAPLGRG